ncbi:MAG: DUF3860 domain-containing protein [Candidatus Poseidoniaceae archaeon]|nr:DUF3860 domain-containing protein [Candidatus Poseidoniaceae archaeon]
MKTVRIREKIKKFLADNPRNTAEILEHINNTMRHGTTSQQLGNVLSKDKDIVKVGHIKRSGILSGGDDICEWATRTWVSDNCPGWIEGEELIIESELGNIYSVPKKQVTWKISDLKPHILNRAEANKFTKITPDGKPYHDLGSHPVTKYSLPDELNQYYSPIEDLSQEDLVLFRDIKQIFSESSNLQNNFEFLTKSFAAIRYSKDSSFSITRPEYDDEDLPWDNKSTSLNLLKFISRFGDYCIASAVGRQYATLTESSSSGIGLGILMYENALIIANPFPTERVDEMNYLYLSLNNNLGIAYLVTGHYQKSLGALSRARVKAISMIENLKADLVSHHESKLSYLEEILESIERNFDPLMEIMKTNPNKLWDNKDELDDVSYA